ncbi:SPOR domain-containing protein [Salinimonas lutimaris]|uniref:SPOR domain-containing protein n=1 Tax=Salinimonas lutimaris TaxID=914153 RepID=UPI0010C0E710|nr:SPOR domain-containing protein [Salinimonas lutimaris]
MAQRDYVSRGRGQGPKKKNNQKPSRQQARQNTRKSNNAPAPGKPLSFKIGLAVILLAGFVWFLWAISGSAPEDVDAPVETVQELKKEDELPEMPEEEWEYIKSLPGYEVEVEVAEQQKSDKLYLLQCGSFRTRAQAEEMKANIAFQGLEAQIRDSAGDNGNWFRVILGPLQTKRDAERARHTLRKINITTCIILTWSI